MNWDTETDMYALLCIKEIGEPTLEPRELYSVLCGDTNGKEM